jgi:tight adherence protein B
VTGPVAAALALSVAVLILPSSPRRRLACDGQVRKPFPLRTAGWLAACALAVSIVLLPLTTVFAGAIFAGTMSLRYRRRRRCGRAIAESQELETAIDVLVGELRVGAHPASAFAVAAEETAGPVASACRAVAARARLGADVTTGLRGVAETSALPAHWGRLAVCWQLAADQGLAMSTLMQAAQLDIVERQRFSAQVRSGMAGARATAAILASLPVLSVLMGELIGARPVAFLLGGWLGGVLLVVGLTFVCGGLLWSDHITERAVAS